MLNGTPCSGPRNLPAARSRSDVAASCKRALALHLHGGVEHRVDGGDPVEMGGDQLAGGDPALPDEARLLAGRESEDGSPNTILAHFGAAAFAMDCRPAGPFWSEGFNNPFRFNKILPRSDHFGPRAPEIGCFSRRAPLPAASRKPRRGYVTVLGNASARLRSMPHSFPTCGHLRKWWGGRPRPRPTPWSASSRCQAYESAAGAGRGRPAQAGGPAPPHFRRNPTLGKTMRHYAYARGAVTVAKPVRPCRSRDGAPAASTARGNPCETSATVSEPKVVKLPHGSRLAIAGPNPGILSDRCPANYEGWCGWLCWPLWAAQAGWYLDKVPATRASGSIAIWARRSTRIPPCTLRPWPS